MIGLVTGIVLEKNGSVLLLETNGGVAYEIAVTPACAVETTVGASMRLYTHLKVSDSSQELFGFGNTAERDFFKLLLTVSGIGPKSALNILGLGSIENIQAAIGRGDIAYLTGVQGMGKKTAERVVVELKTKLKGVPSGVGELPAGAVDVLGDVVDGLVAMGYSNDEARQAAQTLSAVGKTSEQLLRQALQNLSKKQKTGV